MSREFVCSDGGFLHACMVADCHCTSTEDASSLEGSSISACGKVPLLHTHRGCVITRGSPHACMAVKCRNCTTAGWCLCKLRRMSAPACANASQSFSSKMRPPQHDHVACRFYGFQLRCFGCQQALGSSHGFWCSGSCHQPTDKCLSAALGYRVGLQVPAAAVQGRSFFSKANAAQGLASYDRGLGYPSSSTSSKEGLTASSKSAVRLFGLHDYVLDAVIEVPTYIWRLRVIAAQLLRMCATACACTMMLDFPCCGPCYPKDGDCFCC